MHYVNDYKSNNRPRKKMAEIKQHKFMSGSLLYFFTSVSRVLKLNDPTFRLIYLLEN